MSNTYCVYILASRSRNLYTGMGNNLERRMLEHRQELVPGFTGRYRIFRLVYFELFRDVRDAIAREKEIKAWRREKKIRLIESHNPTWTDLAEQLPAKHQKADPSHRSPKSGDRVRDDIQATKPKPIAATPPPVIPNRSTAPADLTPNSLPSTSRAKAREGSAFSATLPKPIAATPPPVILNRSTAPADLAPGPLPSTSRAKAREGSVFSSALSKPTAKP